MRRGQFGSWANDPWVLAIRALRRVATGRRVWIVVDDGSVRVL